MGKFLSSQSVLFFKMKVKKRKSYSFVLFLLRSYTYSAFLISSICCFVFFFFFAPILQNIDKKTVFRRDIFVNQRNSQNLL